MSAEAASYDSVADSYDLIRPDFTPYLEFYESLIKPGTNSILDIACGNGTITSHLSRQVSAALGTRQARAVGIDLSAAMIEAARRRDASVEWMVGDMRSLPAIAPFEVAVCCYNSLQHLDATEFGMALRSIRTLVVKGGRFAFDIYRPNFPYLRQTRTDVLTRIVQGPDGQKIAIREDTRFKESEGILYFVWRLVPMDAPDGSPLATIEHRIWQHRPETVQAALAAAGFRIEEQYGDLDHSPYTPEAKKQVIVCVGD